MSDRAMNFINGEWSWPDGAIEIVSANPADTRETVCVAPDTPAAEVDRAVAAARDAYPSWRRTPPPERAKIITRAGHIMAERKQQLGELVTRECGKPLPEGLGDVQEAIDMAHLAAGEGRRMYGKTAPSELPNKLCMSFREPKGVCGLITPWNFPIAIPAWKGLHALICGNCIVLKPAEDTPMCGVEFVRALHDAGVPAGVVNLVHGRGATTGKALVESDGVDLVSFTGSTQTGASVAGTCGQTGKNVSLECGGKNAQIVMDDANLDLALEGATWGAFGTAGQRCTATSRLIVHEKVYDETVERVVKAASAVKVGNGMHEGVLTGPIINQKQLERVLEYIRIGVDEDNAAVECGGGRVEMGDLAHGWFIAPTVFTGVTRHMRIFREEIFGPVLSVVKVGSLEEAVATLNDCSYGLSSSIYTQDVNAAMWAMREIEAGIVYINGPTIGAEVHMPFGGIKGTGNGHREAAWTGLDIFSEWKTVYVDYSGTLQRAQIDNAE